MLLLLSYYQALSWYWLCPFLHCSVRFNIEDNISVLLLSHWGCTYWDRMLLSSSEGRLFVSPFPEFLPSLSLWVDQSDKAAPAYIRTPLAWPWSRNFCLFPSLWTMHWFSFWCCTCLFINFIVSHDMTTFGGKEGEANSTLHPKEP